LLKTGYPLNRVGGTAASFEIADRSVRLLGGDIFPVALKLTLMSAGATGLGHPGNMRCHAQMERLGKLLGDSDKAGRASLSLLRMQNH
jgi:hypothetical protein